MYKQFVKMFVRNEREKMSDKEFIKQFQKITLAEICRELNTNYFNISGCRAGYTTTKLVAETIQKKLEDLLVRRNEHLKKIEDMLEN